MKPHARRFVIALIPLLPSLACGGGGGSSSRLPATVHVVPGSDPDTADGSMEHPFATLPAATLAIVDDSSWMGNLVVHEGRHELPDEVTISGRAKLEILPGAQFFMGPTSSLHAQTDVNVHGTEADPVLFTWLTPGSHWKSFTNFEPSSQGNVFDHVIFEHGGESEFNGSSMRGALSIKLAGGVIKNCEFRLNEGDDGLNIRASNSIIEDSFFHDNFNDALDSDTAAATGRVEIRNNVFVANGNDGVDLGEKSTAFLHDNVMYGNGDKGVSIGEGSVPVVEHNLIVGNNTGIGIKDRALPMISNNTIVGCNVGVYVYQGVQGMGSGVGSFKNGIVWGSVAADVAITNVNADMAQTEFSYSCIQTGTYRTDLTDQGVSMPITGAGILAKGAGCDDPLFAAPGTIPVPVSGVGKMFALGDFHLQSAAGRWDPTGRAFVTTDTATSPCIDKSDPATDVGTEVAPNGGRADLGAYGGTAEASKTP